MTTRIVLTNRWVYHAEDEREELDIVQAIADVEAGDGSDPEIPKGWIWIGGLYVRAANVIAVEGVHNT